MIYSISDSDSFKLFSMSDAGFNLKLEWAMSECAGRVFVEVRFGVCPGWAFSFVEFFWSGSRELGETVKKRRAHQRARNRPEVKYSISRKLHGPIQPARECPQAQYTPLREQGLHRNPSHNKNTLLSSSDPLDQIAVWFEIFKRIFREKVKETC